MPRVALVISHDGPGGVPLIFEQLSTGLEERGFAVDRIALQQQQTTPRAGWMSIFPRQIRAWEIPEAVRRLAQTFKRHGPYDALITSMPLANSVAPVAGRLAGVRKRIVTHQSPTDTYERPQRLLDLVVGTSPAVDHIICASDAVRQSVSAYPSGYRRKTVVVLNALTEEVATFIDTLVLPKREDVVGRPVRLVSVGRLAEQKNFSVLFPTLAQLPEARLQLVGDGPLSDQLRGEAASHGVADRVEFLGHLPHLEGLRIAAKADIFVQPSLFEGRSIALLEAAALGLPLLVSDVPSQIEAVTRDDGQVCAEVARLHDPASYAASIRRTIGTAGHLDQLSRLSRSLAAEASLGSIAEEYVRLIATP